MAIDIVVRDNHFHYNGINYFRGNADSLTLGDVGRKKKPATQTNYLEVLGNVPRKQLKIHSASRVDIHGVDFGSADIGVSLQVPGKGSMSAGSVASALKDETLSLLKLVVLPKDIIAAANAAEKNALTPLKQAGNDGRILHIAFVVLEMKTAVVFHGATGFEASADLGPLTITAKGGLAGTSGKSVTVPPGGVFAYLLLKPEWDASLKKNWQFIKDGKDDQWSVV